MGLWESSPNCWVVGCSGCVDVDDTAVLVNRIGVFGTCSSNNTGYNFGVKV